MLKQAKFEELARPIVSASTYSTEKTVPSTGNQKIDRIIANSRFAKLRQQLLRSSNLEKLDKAAELNPEALVVQCHDRHDLPSKSDSSQKDSVNGEDYDSSLPAEFLPTQGLPFTLRSSSLGFSRKIHTSTNQKSFNSSLKGRSSLSVPLDEPKVTIEHRVRFLTGAASEDNLTTRRINTIKCTQDRIHQTNRRVTLSNLPVEASFSDVFSLVWGGKVESMRRSPQTAHASIIFVTHEACAAYQDATREGIRNAFDEDDRLVIVKPETLISSDLATSKYHNLDDSRCVQIAGSKISWKDIEELEILAGDDERTFELFMVKKTCKLRALEIRFLSIHEARSFISAFVKEKPWSHLVVSYCADPCAIAEGIHR